MGGRTRQTQTSNTSQQGTQTTSAPGTQFGTNVLNSIESSGIMGDIFSQGSYSGDRVATQPAPSNGFVTQWGDLPDTFVPGRTTADSPFQVDRTYVDQNYQPGIAEGLAAATGQRDQLAELSNQGLTRWGEVLSGQDNPALETMLRRLREQHAETAARSTNQMASIYGQQGAFGGTDFGRDFAWAEEQRQGALDDATAQLLWQNYDRNNEMLLAAPGAIAGMAGVGTMTADRLLHYGGLDLENQAYAAAVGDENAQRDANNAWLTGTLNDSNAMAAAADALARWQANYQVADAQTQEGVAQSEFAQQNNQAGLDNDFYRWLSENESLNETLNRLGMLLSFSGMVPGGTTNSNASGTSTSTTTTSQSASPLQILGSLIGAGLQFGLPGIGQLGGITNNPVGASERRLKENIDFLFEDRRGVRWYTFNYKDDPTKTPITGVMVDELEPLAPHVIGRSNGIKTVDYIKLNSWMG